MKPIAALALALLALLPVSVRAQEVPLLLASVKGTVSSQEGTTVEDARTHVEKFDNDRLFTEFGVSKSDYALVLSIGSEQALFFRQKNASGALPDVVIFSFDTQAGSLDAKKKVYTLGYGTSSPGTGTVFEDATGTITGTVSYKGAVQSFDLIKGSFKYSGIANSAVLRFSIKVLGQF